MMFKKKPHPGANILWSKFLPLFWIVSTNPMLQLSATVKILTLSMQS